ncbi:MAG: PQQ-binding-like beta-propeller repeat protein [Proteiniphilum sp.]|jgi:outer membrane protein assembly factor BamB|nr:PQQ-binding-like beta-propeller repeat protein [Proteiniphilum sp.]
MRKILLFIAALCATAGCSDRAIHDGKPGGADWPLFRGDASLSGYTDESLPKRPKLLWEFKTDVRTASSPVVLGGVAYWCDRRGMIRGVNIEGEQVFEYDLKTAVEATPMIYDSTLYVGRIDGIMSAVSLRRNDTIWNFETMGQISASPNLFKFNKRKAIIIGSYDNLLYCIDARTGEELSRFRSGYYINGAAAFWKGHVIYGGCDALVRMIDCKTGIQTDSLLLEAYIPASPAIMGDYCYIGDYSGNIYKIMLEDGKFVRHKKIAEASKDGGGSFVSVPAVSIDAFYYISDNRYLNSVSRKNGKVLWKYLLKGNAGESSPVICSDRVIVCTKTGTVSILETFNGKLLWEYDAGEPVTASPAVIGKHFFILTARGTLLCFGEQKKTREKDTGRGKTLSLSSGKHSAAGQNI